MPMMAAPWLVVSKELPLLVSRSKLLWFSHVKSIECIRSFPKGERAHYSKEAALCSRKWDCAMWSVMWRVFFAPQIGSAKKRFTGFLHNGNYLSSPWLVTLILFRVFQWPRWLTFANAACLVVFGCDSNTCLVQLSIDHLIGSNEMCKIHRFQRQVQWIVFIMNSKSHAMSLHPSLLEAVDSIDPNAAGMIHDVLEDINGRKGMVFSDNGVVTW